MIGARNDARVDGAFTEMAALVSGLPMPRPSKLNEEERAALTEYLDACRTCAEDAIRRAEQQTDRAKRLADVAEGLVAALTSDDVVRVILEVGVPTVGAFAGALMLLSPDGQHLELAGAIGYPTDLLERYQRFSIAAPLPPAAARERRPVYIRSIDEWAARFELKEVTATRPQNTSWACVPLSADRHLMGVLAFTVQRAGAFDDDDQVFIASLAHESALAPHAVRRHHRVRRSVARRRSRNGQRRPGRLARAHPRLRTAPVGHGQRHDQSGESRVSCPSVAAGRLRRVRDRERSRQPCRAARPPKKLRFVRSLPEGRMTMVTDGSKMRQIALKLVANAIKFTDEGEVGIALEPSSSSICVRVRDMGIGIDPTNVEKIFEAFWQVERGFARRTTGPGLGLAVARRLARLLGGDIEVTPTRRAGRRCGFPCRRPSGV